MEPLMYTVDEFCSAHRLSRSALYKQWNNGTGPRTVRIGTKVLVTREAAADWRRERETASAQATPETEPAAA